MLYHVGPIMLYHVGPIIKRCWGMKAFFMQGHWYMGSGIGSHCMLVYIVF